MKEYPTGTLTFLLTDIEGSTELWERYPEAMRTALAHHDEIVEGCVDAHGGTVVRPGARETAASRFFRWRKTEYALGWRSCKSWLLVFRTCLLG